MSLFAQGENDTSEIPLARCVDHIGRTRAFAAHAHVERPIVAEREAALAAIKLHRGDAKIEHDAVDRLMPGIVRDGFEIGKAVFDQGQAAACLLDQVCAKRDRGLVTVDTDHLAVGGRKNGARIAARAEGAVDIDAAIANAEKADSMAAEHGNVEGWSASDSRAAAAHHHSRAPGAYRAATWELSRPLSARTFWVASASSFWKRPGSQI